MAERLDSRDKFPSGYDDYLSNYGWHVSPKLCDFMVSKMKGRDGKAFTPYSKDKVESLLKQYGVELENDKAYDKVYVCNMAVADYLGSSVPNEQYLAKFIKDYLDDPDGAETRAMDELFAKTIALGMPIIWQDML
ncbi:MAG: hypothetical protein J1E33_06555 [Alistipes sp.]|nr:hypothetical protein [Alistipes sp.]